MNEAIDQYQAGIEKLRAAVRGLSPAEMTAVPAADAGVGLWSIHQIVIHLQDSEIVGIDRMKRVIAEPNPLLVGYNENLFMKNLSYELQSAEQAIQIIELLRGQFAKTLRQLPEEAFARTGIHTEIGKVTLATEIKKYTWHMEHHLSFVHKKRARMGK